MAIMEEGITKIAILSRVVTTKDRTITRREIERPKRATSRLTKTMASCNTRKITTTTTRDQKKTTERGQTTNKTSIDNTRDKTVKIRVNILSHRLVFKMRPTQNLNSLESSMIAPRKLSKSNLVKITIKTRAKGTATERT